MNRHDPVPTTSPITGSGTSANPERSNGHTILPGNRKQPPINPPARKNGQPHRHEKSGLERAFDYSRSKAALLLLTKVPDPGRDPPHRSDTDPKTHIQAMLSLARRRLNVLWAMLRDGTIYTPTPVAVLPIAA
ncbi:hypothetical protein AB0O52_20250 [Arthrobacter sp. NPDC080073]|uniref:hypothetical protein n=1 Tax=Arthrobacter sp. NPDC080073 TaxID=3155919 RepID=UPI003417DDF7